MKLDEYHAEAMRTRPGFGQTILQPEDAQLLNAVMGLSGEAGEALDHVKKHLFQGHPLDEEKVKKEIGDALWYIVEAADAMDVSLEDIAAMNIAKLRKRYPHGFSAERSLNRPDE